MLSCTFLALFVVTTNLSVLHTGLPADCMVRLLWWSCKCSLTPSWGTAVSLLHGRVLAIVRWRLDKFCVLNRLGRMA